MCKFIMNYRDDQMGKFRVKKDLIEEKAVVLYIIKKQSGNLKILRYLLHVKVLKER